jgi:hypothetical protein
MSKVKMMIAGTLALGAATLALGASVAFADKLSDFKEADRYDEGCRTIPVTYSSDRDSCDREGPNVHPWCDGEKGPVTCVSEEETRKAKRGIEDAKKNIDDLKDKKSKAESNKSNAKTDDEKKNSATRSPGSRRKSMKAAKGSIRP